LGRTHPEPVQAARPFQAIVGGVLALIAGILIGES
jgi:hypothetical protein